MQDLLFAPFKERLHDFVLQLIEHDVFERVDLDVLGSDDRVRADGLIEFREFYRIVHKHAENRVLVLAIICPDYEICRWDESNYDVMKNAYMKAAYGARKWAFVSDYARLDVVYQYGGFYLDTDVELVKPLDELRYNKACMGMEETDCVAIGLGFGAVPKYPAIKMLRDAYRAFRFTDFHTLKEKAERKIEPSPKLLSRELEPYGFQYDCCKLQDVCGIRIYPIPVLSGMIARTIVVTDCTYSIHHFAGTWVPKK